MAQLGDFLSRFRPAGAPGAVSRAAVPADKAAELAVELDPVLELFASADAECTRIAAEAAREAERIAADAAERAAAITARGKDLAAAAREQAAADVIGAAREQAAAAEQDAARRAAARTGPAEADVRQLTRAAIDLVWSLAASPGQAGPGGANPRAGAAGDAGPREHEGPGR